MDSAPTLRLHRKPLPLDLLDYLDLQEPIALQNRTQTPMETITKALESLKEWESAQPPTDKLQQRLPLPPQIKHQNPREIFCNTDASWKARNAGLAWIFTDGSNLELDCGSLFQSSVSSPCTAEALAIREALIDAASRQFSHICIRTDSQVLVQAISSRRNTSELYGVLSDIDELSFSPSSALVSCRFIFVPRTSNGLADDLAKKSVLQPILVWAKLILSF